MGSTERRIDSRVNVRVPLRFRTLDDSDSIEQTAESENLSQRGMFFTTSFPLKVGTPLEVSLRMPLELAGAGKSTGDVKCVARVVRVQANSFLGNRSGIGVHIERYMARASAAERWAS